MRFRLLGCLMLGALLVSSSGTAAAGASNDAGQTRVLLGTALPTLRHATLLHATPVTAPIDVVVSLKPRHPELLAQMAATSSGRPALSPARINAWFLPRPATVSKVSQYMHAKGFSLTASDGLSLSFRGDAGAVGRAFAVRLGQYRNTISGRAFRAPDGAVQLPADIASLVRTVSGLDSALVLEHKATIAPPAPQAVTPQPGCNGPAAAKAAQGGYLPADIAAAYGHDTLLANNYDGDGQGIALVEFSTYKPKDITDFRTCFGLNGPNATVIQNVPVNGGTSDHSGAIEVELDMQIALAHAPGLDHLYVYRAPNNISQFIAMVNQMSIDSQTTDLSIISDSWGLCEAAMPVSTMQAESEALQLAAVHGLSFYVASGDDGASGCYSAFGVTDRITDDPASQPFATGVGGTTLTLPGSLPGKAWKRGGGGVSMVWPMPAYQQPVGTHYGGAKCGNPSGDCRQVPDVALNADPATGYIIKCTDLGCPKTHPWFSVGGTSAAAPLMAAITADANEYSVTNLGSNLGYANPCLYAAAGTSTFVDVITGNNALFLNPGGYAAASGFDNATGLGSPQASAFADMVKACTTHAPASQSTTVLSAATTPASPASISYGQAVTFQGDLTSGATPLADRAVYIEFTQGRFIYLYKVMTDAGGHWTRTFATPLRRNTKWRVFFPGSDTEEPAKSTVGAIYVTPKLTNTLSSHAIRFGQHLIVSGRSTPNMTGLRLMLQARRSNDPNWLNVGLVGVRTDGSYRVSVDIGGRPATWRLRWSYTGGTTRALLSAVSDVESVSIR